MIDPAIARTIRVVGLDVDGVLTDGGITSVTLPEPATSSSATTFRTGSASIFCARQG